MPFWRSLAGAARIRSANGGWILQEEGLCGDTIARSEVKGISAGEEKIGV
jgi:hypothetical protein